MTCWWHCGCRAPTAVLPQPWASHIAACSSGRHHTITWHSCSAGFCLPAYLLAPRHRMHHLQVEEKGLVTLNKSIEDKKTGKFEWRAWTQFLYGDKHEGSEGVVSFEEQHILTWAVTRYRWAVPLSLLRLHLPAIDPA